MLHQQYLRHLAYQDHINPTMTVPVHIENLDARAENRAKAAQRFRQKMRKNKLFQESQLKEVAAVPTSVELLHLKLAKINIDMEKKRTELELQRAYITANNVNRIYSVDSPPKPNLCIPNLVRHVCFSNPCSPVVLPQFQVPWGPLEWGI